ncbi:PAF acetylhydrolase family protein [Delitschia confertaspora ATCC 74209]|uniref:1-alkyl-2-acetylglycerophosphocholine esterase n=1 Tax=Delitschia confertaspora ATCC 74209 TaxID=1513339 RepID=A0A9P4JQM2_9PLEO|nr:PAF acetylhydrolase family protein [Delitschia confertaspora ATCC 74209]
MNRFSHVARPRALSLSTLLFFLAFYANGKILIPPPEGKYAVSMSSTKLVDPSRTDPYDPNHGQRAVMVSLFYPVPIKECEQTCIIDYMPPTTARYLDAVTLQYGVPNGTYEQFQLEVCCKRSERRTPAPDTKVVLFSHGLYSSRQWYNSLVQHIASAGYAVVSIDHPYDALVVEFPDGSYILNETIVSGSPDNDDGSYAKGMEVRAADSKFVLNQLGNATVVQELLPEAECGFQVKKAAMFGHSYGGATSIRMVQTDKRIIGALDLDGQVFGNPSDIHRPVFLFGRTDHNRSTERTWGTYWDYFKDWRREFDIGGGATHLTFGDLVLLTNLAGIPPIDILGTMDGARAIQITSTYVAAFLDFVFKGKKNPILDGNSNEFPEITRFE